MPRLTSSLLVSALAAAALAAPAAHAGAPRTVCRLVSDAAGDEVALAGQKPPTLTPDQSVDIASADVASDGKYLTVVVRYAKLAQPNPDFRKDAFYLKVRNGSVFNQFAFEVTKDVTGIHPTFYYRDAKVSPGALDNSSITTLAQPTYGYDLGKNELRMSVPATATTRFSPLKKGVLINDLRIEAYRSYTGGRNFEVSDRAEGGAARSYTVGTTSCVRPGK